jgi:formamidopyrimidine-DNA glycosylase
MPELPEVQTVVNTLSPRIVSAKVLAVELLRPDIVTPHGAPLQSRLVGKTVRDVSRRGKRIVITLNDANRFYIHLGMSGRLTLEQPGVQVLKHTHLILRFEGFEVRFRDPRRFGGVWWLGDSSDPSHDTMGPEPLTMSADELAARLSKTKRAVKNALLDQRVVAGLGNIYVDESLFAAGIHPLIRSDRLKEPQVRRLDSAIKQTLVKALKHRGSTLRDYVDAEGGRGAFQNLHNVYDRGGEPCRICGKPIRRIVLGGRSTCFCASCQPRGSRRSAQAGRSR